jgi:hypothetical protein
MQDAHDQATGWDTLAWSFRHIRASMEACADELISRSRRRRIRARSERGAVPSPHARCARWQASMSQTWTDRVLEALRLSRQPLDDDELARRLGASQRQTVNQTCRRLEATGAIERYVGRDGKIVNRVRGNHDAFAALTSSPARAPAYPGELLTEDEVKAAVKSYLEAEGWIVQVAWGRDRGIDIRATRNQECLYWKRRAKPPTRPSRSTTSLARSGNSFSG